MSSLSCRSKKSRNVLKRAGKIDVTVASSRIIVSIPDNKLFSNRIEIKKKKMVKTKL